MPRDPFCKKCKMSGTCQTICVWGDGVPGAHVMVVGEAPGETEDIQGKPFVGKSGSVLRKLLGDMLDPAEVYISNVVKCRPPENRKPSEREIRVCLPYLLEEIRTVRPKILLLLGSTAISAISGKKGVRVSDYRLVRSWVYEKANVICTYHPAAVLRNANLLDSFIEDLNRIFSNEFVAPETVGVRRVAAAQAAMIPSTLAFDLETTQIDPFLGSPEILCVAWSGSKNRAYSTTNWQSWVDAVEAKKPKLLIGHNIKFDLLWLAAQGRPLKGLPLADTMVLRHLLDERKPQSLKDAVLELTGYGHYDEPVRKARVTGQMKSLDKNVLLDYCGYDAAATYRVWCYLRGKLSTKQGRLFSMLMSVTSALVEMEQRGIRVSTSRMKRLQDELVSRIGLIGECMTQLAPNLNPDSSKALQTHIYTDLELPVLRRTKNGNPSVDEEAITRLLHLPSLDDQKKKFLEALMERRGVKKLLSTYVEGMQEKLDHGRLHTTFRITGTVTGRLSSASPNLQNIPRGPQVRNLFAASPGKVLLEADYSQIELRMGAFLTRDERMLKLLRDGVDLHTATGEAIYGRKVTKEERYLAKTVNFGIFYGMGPRRLVEETGMALSTARSFIRSWYDLYPGVAAWQKEVEKELISKGEIEGLFGRKRHLEVAVDKDEYLEQVRMACNFPVQNAAAELTLMALGLLSSGLQLPLVLTVHDSILCEVPQDKTQEWSGHIRRTMTNANDLIRAFGFKLKLDVPILVEIKSGKYWGSMKEVSHA